MFSSTNLILLIVEVYNQEVIQSYQDGDMHMNSITNQTVHNYQLKILKIKKLISAFFHKNKFYTLLLM